MPTDDTLYRYDRDDIDCEVFAFARRMACAKWKFVKAVYAGDREDLEQVAMLAAVQVAESAADRERVSAAAVAAAVNAALADEYRGMPTAATMPTAYATEPSILSGESLEYLFEPAESPQPPMTDDEIAAVNTLRHTLTVVVGGEERLCNLIRHLVDGDSPAAIAADSPLKRRRPTAAVVARRLEEDAAALATRLPLKTLKRFRDAKKRLGSLRE